MAQYPWPPETNVCGAFWGILGGVKQLCFLPALILYDGFKIRPRTTLKPYVVK